MEKADELSRWLDWKVSIGKNNENQIFIKDNWICRLEKVGPEVEIVEKIKKARSKNKDVVRVVEKIKKAKVKEL